MVGNAVGIISVDRDTVIGNVLLQSNSTLVLQGSDIVANNLIGGNLVCIGNTPPTEHGGNTVGGNKIGQCVGLQPGYLGEAQKDLVRALEVSKPSSRRSRDLRL